MSKVIEPRKFGPESEVGHPRSEGPLYRILRRMSKHPRAPRVFSQARLFVPFGMYSTIVGFSGVIPRIANEYLGYEPFGEAIALTAACFVFFLFLANGLWRRFGVDDDKVWTRFGKVFYREVRFSEVTRFRTGYMRYKLSAGRTMVNVDYNRFDYTPVYYGLLRELQKRRFELPDKVMPGDANWEEEAQLWRNILAQDIFDAHSEFLLAHPEELAYLNSLTEPPESYEE